MSATHIISLNQLVDLFKSFAQLHPMINDFGYGPTSDIGVSRQMKFPYLWLTIDQNTEIIPQNKTAIPLMGFTVLFMDKTNIQQNYLDINGLDSDNRQETLSDTFQYLQDLITEIDNNWNNYGIKFDGSINAFPGVDETTDKVNGWVGRFRLKLRHSNCITPLGDIIPTNLSPINPFTRYLTCETLSGCTVIQTIQNQIRTSFDKYVGVMYLKDNSTPTPITQINQRKVVVGDIQTGILNNFIKDTTTNSLKYVGPPARFQVITTFNFYEGNQRTCGFYIGHNTDDTTPLDPNGDRISESEIYINSSNPSTQPIGGSIQTVLDLNTNDRVFFIVQNKDAATNITVEFMKFVITEL
jgi:hypothetical protein